MNSNNNKPILVIGGTGTQGGSVARELLSQRQKERILTRNITSEAAKKFAKLGAEVVQGDMGSFETLLPALENVTAVFSAQYADPADPMVEMNNAGNLVRAAREAGVTQVIHTSAAGNMDLKMYQTSIIILDSKVCLISRLHTNASTESHQRNRITKM